MSDDAFVILDGVLSIPAWEWDSTQSTIYGIPVQVNLYRSPEWGASFALQNGAIIAIRAMKWDLENHDQVSALVLRPIVPETAAYPMVDPFALLALIREAGTDAG